MLHGPDHKPINYPLALACHIVFSELPRLLSPASRLGSVERKGSRQSREGWLIAPPSLSTSPTLDRALGLKCSTDEFCSPPCSFVFTVDELHLKVPPKSPWSPVSDAPTWKSPSMGSWLVEAGCCSQGRRLRAEHPVGSSQWLLFVKHLLPSQTLAGI